MKKVFLFFVGSLFLQSCGPDENFSGVVDVCGKSITETTSFDGKKTFYNGFEKLAVGSHEFGDCVAIVTDSSITWQEKRLTEQEIMEKIAEALANGINEQKDETNEK